jgi:hypothetical protein
MTKKAKSQIREILVLQERMNRVFMECHLNTPSGNSTSDTSADKDENAYLFIFKPKLKKHRTDANASRGR